jgi:hypothetical protein
MRLKNKRLFAEVGEGNVNWPAILSAARAAKVQWYIVEQDICRRDPFESMAIGFRNLRQMGVKQDGGGPASSRVKRVADRRVTWNLDK